MLCLKCGHVNRDNAKFCAQCGAAFVPPTPPPAAPKATAPSASTPATSAGAGAGAGAGASAAQAAAASSAAPGRKTEAHAPTDSASLGGATHVPPAESDASQVPGKLALWLTGATMVCLLVATLVWLYLLNRGSAHPHFAVSLPPISAPERAPPPIQRPQPLPSLPSEAAMPTTPEQPKEEIRRKPAAASATAAQPLGEQQRQQLVHRLQQAPPPASCAEGIARVKHSTGRATAEARDIAKLAYPQHCTETVATVKPPPSLPSKAERTIDQAYKQRAAAECEQGLLGLFCREKIRNSLCEGHWSLKSTAGQTICQQSDTGSYQ